jgi:hypothetical protein
VPAKIVSNNTSDKAMDTFKSMWVQEWGKANQIPWSFCPARVAEVQKEKRRF